MPCEKKASLGARLSFSALKRKLKYYRPNRFVPAQTIYCKLSILVENYSVELLRDFAEKRGKKGRMSAPSHPLRQKLTPYTKIDGDDFAGQNIQISVGWRYEI